MLHRTIASYTNQDTSMSIDFFEVCRWFFFYFFIETCIPFFLDPLQLTGNILDIPILDWFELVYFVFIPNLVIFFNEETSPYGSTYGLLLYLFCTSTPLFILQRYIFQDLFVLISISSMLLEFFAVEPNEESYYDD
jgi:hypothetical protein